MGARQHNYRPDPAAADAWMARATCLGMDPDLFFPVGSIGAAAAADHAAAKRVCATCPVRRPCLEYAMVHSLNEGVWGETSPDDRREIRRQRNLARRRANRASRAKPNT